MRIKHMTAKFGVLEQARLTAGPGLTVIYAPNEAGKSTWCAFLRAMLYGIPTRERDTKAAPAEKNRWQPWAGGPMEGELALTWQGRSILLRRFERAGVPFGGFEAVDEGTGDPVPGLSADSVGETLTGVSRRTWEQSAFVGQGRLGAGSSRELESRITALLTAGEEEHSFAEAEERLKQWRNRRKYNQSGLIPRLEGHLEQIDHTLARDRLVLARLEEARAAAAEARKRAWDPLFSGLTGEEAWRRAEQDAAMAGALERQGRRVRVMATLIAVLLTALGGGMAASEQLGAVLPGPLGGAGVWLILAGVLVWGAGAVGLGRRYLRGATDFYARYGADDEVGLKIRAYEYREEWLRVTEVEKRADALADVLGGRAELREQREEVVARLERLREEHRALELALEALAEAEGMQRTQVSPDLNRRAGELLEGLTGGRYDAVSLDREAQASARAAGALRPTRAALLSRGAADQLYLAVRLAVCDLLLSDGETSPIVLDDALVNLDDERLVLALDTLRTLGQERQILLFTCHRREMEYLSGMEDVTCLFLQ